MRILKTRMERMLATMTTPAAKYTHLHQFSKSAGLTILARHNMLRIISFRVKAPLDQLMSRLLQVILSDFCFAIH